MKANQSHEIKSSAVNLIYEKLNQSLKFMTLTVLKRKQKLSGFFSSRFDYIQLDHNCLQSTYDNSELKMLSETRLRLSNE